MEWYRSNRVLSGTDRGGVIQGYTPIHSSLQLYLIQVIVIVILCFFLGQLVKRWNQPRVIAEVIAGVLLGPSALGAIPGFTDKLFPDDSLEALTLTAHLGLILFLFIVGLELDPGLFRSNAKKAGILSITGQAVTWVLSLGVSQAMMAWLDGVESGTSFVLFIGVSLSVTAFPVLSRILGENSLMNTSVGALVISAASVDEACVWCLLALVVSTVNAGSPIDAFYVFLLLVLFVALMLTVVRWAVLQVVREVSGEDEGPPSRGVVILCMLLTLVSAWVTDFIGIDAIFGAFVAGIIVPRENSLHVRIAELIQDVVSVLLLPLYFAVSGLKTNLTLLDNATSWGICAITISAACIGKIGGGATVARFFGMTYRESLAVGVLMNTRGLVELIILNIGLDAGVLTEEVMAIMVVMALVTTFLTAPLSAVVYPLKYHTLPGLKARRRVFDDSAGDLSRPLTSIPDIGEFAQNRLKLMVMVSNPAALGAVARVAKLFGGSRPAKKEKELMGSIRRKLSGRSTDNAGGGDMELHALRLVGNTDRYSSDMRALERAENTKKDSLANILQGFLGLLMIKVRIHLSVGTPTDFSQDVTNLTIEHGISTVIFPWESESMQATSQLTRVEKLMETTPCQFVVALNCHTAALANSTLAGVSVLVPFFGSDDDIAALLLALAIVEKDPSAELVILSFLEPERGGTGGGTTASSSTRRAGGDAGVGRVDASGSNRAKGGSIMAARFTSPRRAIGPKRFSDKEAPNPEEGAALVQERPLGEQDDEEKDGKHDVEAGVIVDGKTGTEQARPAARTPRAAAVHSASGSMAQSTGNVNAIPSSSGIPSASGAGTQRSVPWLRQTSSPWSARELVRRVEEEIDRVKVLTTGWSLHTALSAMSSKPNAGGEVSGEAGDGDELSAAASIVQEVVATQSSGLVLCGCAGSGQAYATAMAAAAGDGEAVGPATEGVGRDAGAAAGPRASAGVAAMQAPLSGANSVHGRWPSLGPLGRSSHGHQIRSRHGQSLSLMTRTWHGKSRHRVRHHPSAAGMGERGEGHLGGRQYERRGRLPTVLELMIEEALENLIGDVAGGLMRSDRAPAVLAVRASKSTTQPRP